MSVYPVQDDAGCAYHALIQINIYPIGRHISVPLPYVKGVSEPIRRTLQHYGINSYFKPQNTFRSLVCVPKDRLPSEEKCDCLYRIWGGVHGKDCDSSYIGETERALLESRSIAIRAREKYRK